MRLSCLLLWTNGMTPFKSMLSTPFTAGSSRLLTWWPDHKSTAQNIPQCCNHITMNSLCCDLLNLSLIPSCHHSKQLIQELSCVVLFSMEHSQATEVHECKRCWASFVPFSHLSGYYTKTSALPHGIVTISFCYSRSSFFIIILLSALFKS